MIDEHPDLTAASIDDISLPLPNGKTLRVGPAMSLYHTRPRSTQSTEQMAKALQLFLQLAGSKIRYVEIDGQAMLPVSQTDPAAYPEFLVNSDPAAPIMLTFHGGAEPDEAHPIYFRCKLPADWQPQPISYVTTGMSMAQLEASPLPLTEWTAQTSALILPEHGSAGFTLTAWQDWAYGNSTTDYITALLEAFPGLDHPATPTGIWVTTDGPVAANWITVLDDALLGKIGGAQAISSFMERAGGGTISYPGGMALVAPGSPQIGDSRKGIIPIGYRIVGAKIRYLRGMPEAVYFPGGKTRNTKKFGQDWRARFDEPPAEK